MINDNSSNADTKIPILKILNFPKGGTEEKKQDDNQLNNKQEDYPPISPRKRKIKRPMKREVRNIIDDKYEFFPSLLLGKGEYGDVCICCDLLDSTKHYAIKFENSFLANKLKLEKEILDLMVGVEGFPTVIGNGSFKSKNYLVLERLGPNLKDLFQYCYSHFSLQTILLIGIQILTRLHDFHYKSGFIHGDVKPDNFVIGLKTTNLIHMIDFGSSKPFRIFNNQSAKIEHIPYKDNIKAPNSNKFVSINTHMGIEQSRRDDLESLGYMLIYFANNSLPWEGGSKSNKEDKSFKMLEKKTTIPVEVYCKDLPIEFCVYMNYVRNLRFNEKPDYNYLKTLFAELLFTYYIEKFYLDWGIQRPKEIPSNLRMDKELDNKTIGLVLEEKKIKSSNMKHHLLKNKDNSLIESEEDKSKDLKQESLISSSAKESDSQQLSFVSKIMKNKQKVNEYNNNNKEFIKEINDDSDNSSQTESNQTEQNSFFNDEDFVSMFKEVVVSKHNSNTHSKNENSNNSSGVYKVNSFKRKTESSATYTSNSNSIGPLIDEPILKSNLSLKSMSSNKSNEKAPIRGTIGKQKKQFKKINEVEEEPISNRK